MLKLLKVLVCSLYQAVAVLGVGVGVLIKIPVMSPPPSSAPYVYCAKKSHHYHHRITIIFQAPCYCLFKQILLPTFHPGFFNQ